jgi:tetratricopeptide (TPR) repeat protein
LMIPKETSRVVLDLTLGEKARARGYDGANCVKDALGREFGTQPSLATLQWDVVLESFDAAVNWYKADVKEMLDEALVIKEEANALFKTGVYELARAKYEKTLHKLEGVRGLDDQDEYERVQAMKNTLALNLVATLQKLHQHVDALARVNKLLESYPENEKALFRRSVSLLALHEFSAARDDLFACLDLNPALQSTIAKQLDLVKRAEAQTHAKARERFRFKM